MIIGDIKLIFCKFREILCKEEISIVVLKEEKDDIFVLIKVYSYFDLLWFGLLRYVNSP